jgi:hypothetical protein
MMRSSWTWMEQPGAGAKRLAKTSHAAIYRYWRQQITGVRSDLFSQTKRYRCRGRDFYLVRAGRRSN